MTGQAMTGQEMTGQAMTGQATTRQSLAVEGKQKQTNKKLATLRGLYAYL